MDEPTDPRQGRHPPSHETTDAPFWSDQEDDAAPPSIRSSEGALRTQDSDQSIVEHLDLRGSIFRANHASNYLPLKGKLPTDKDAILAEIDKGLAGDRPLRPEYYRGL